MIKKFVKSVVSAPVKVVKSVVGAVGDVVSSVAGAVGDVVKSVGKVAKSAVDSVAKVISSTFQEVKKAVDVVAQFARPMLENYAIQAALTAAGVPVKFAAPMAAAGGTLARGGTPEDALKSAAIQTAGQVTYQGVYDSAIQNRFSPAQAAAAASAASSATQTAIAGGNLEDALKAAAIGGISSAASSQVLKETKSAELATFTRVATTGVLQGQSLEQAILQGASSSAVQFATQYFEESRATQARVAQVETERNKVIKEYNDKYGEYSYYVDAYNEYARTGVDPSRKHFEPGSEFANKNNFSVEWYRERIDRSLADVNALSDQIGGYNQQIADLYRPLQSLLDKANQAGADIGSFEEYANQQIRSEEELLLAQIEEATRSLERYRPEDLMALSPGQVAGLGPMVIEITTGPRTLYETSDGPLQIDITGPRTLYETSDGSLRIDENLQVFEDGNFTFQFTPEEYDTFALKYGFPQRNMEGAPGEQLPVTGLVDLRDATGGKASGVVLIGTGGGEGEGGIGGGAPGGTGDFTLPFALIGQDAQGNDKMVVGDQTFTLITIGNQKVLKNDFSEVYFLPEVGPTENTPIKLTPVDVQVDEQNQVKVTPTRETMIGGGQGGQPSQQVFERVTSSAAQTAQQIAQQQDQIRNLLLQQQMIVDQVQRVEQERARIAQQKQALQQAVAGSISPVTTQQAQQALANLDATEKQLNAYQQQVSQQNRDIETQLRNTETAILTAQREAERQQREVEQFLRERQEIVTRTQAKRFEEELAEFDRDLAKLEADIAGALSDVERSAAQRSFVEQQKQRLARSNRLPGTLQEQIDEEIRGFIREYEAASGALSAAEEERRGLTRPSEAESQRRGVTEQDVMRLLGLGREDVERFGFTPAGETEGAPVEGEGEGAGQEGVGAGGEGEGVGTGEEGDLGAGEGEGVIPSPGVKSIVRVRPSGERRTQGIPSRVTGEALVGILGEKEPLFGGDEDEQQAVWNRRSLRLRKALGL